MGLLPNTPLRDDQMNETADIGAAVRADWIRVPFMIVGIVLLAGALAVVLGIDFAILLEVFTYYLADSDETPATAYVLACAGFTVILGLHIFAWNGGAPIFLGLLRALAKVAILLLVIGVGLKLALDIYESGASSSASSLESQIDLFLGEETETAPSPVQTTFEDRIAPAIPVLFTIGLGGLMLISVLVGHALIETIAEQLERAMRIRGRIRAVNARETKLGTACGTYATARQRLERMMAEDPDARVRRHAVHISAAGLEALAPAERYLATRRLTKPDAFDGLAGGAFGIPRTLEAMDIDELEAVIAAIREALDVDRIAHLIADPILEGDLE